MKEKSKGKSTLKIERDLKINNFRKNTAVSKKKKKVSRWSELAVQ
tara:strand:+ start:298 stop:432 length:135 start_codon:yes stop_codon:yes gene_type:complete